MGDLTESIQLLIEERDLILKHGYPFERLKRALRRWPANRAYRTVRMSKYELEMLIGELSRSFNHGETGKEEDDVLQLCDRLEYAERTGDGDLDIMW
jgi:hypothetical protein